ncbi:hypothetical protein ACFS7Z_08520 [Pontibacter toksunensis]|uniref:Outer membrane efflux protein n=1 Tax=Pontibacter toksunensis TaxID=1332631 RepID=A0ABW6BU70_9BACT
MAVAERAVAQSEKAQAVSERTTAVQELKNFELLKREEGLKANIKIFNTTNEELKMQSRAYKKGFVDSYVNNNKSVRIDFERFSTEGNEDELEKRLKEQFLWTALTRYEEYILTQKINTNQKISSTIQEL